ncbi:hypothetical protein JCM10207_007529 [Rhodosporidiobolus poonsookiae]
MATETLSIDTRLHDKPGAAQEPANTSLPSPPLTPVRHNPLSGVASLAADSPEGKKEKHQRWIREAGCHFSLFIAGWGDASSGPLIPYIQSHYNLSYTLFIGQMCGFLLSSFLTSPLFDKFGLGKLIVIGAVLQGTAYALLIPAFPFPAFPVIYACGGLGLALQDAAANVYVASLPGSEKKLGWLHASYGLGAAVVPLAATAFASSGILFSRFYSISLGIAVINVVILLYAFKFSYRMDPDAADGTVEEPGLPPAQIEPQGESIELAERGRSSPVPSSELAKPSEPPSRTETAPPSVLDTSLPSSRAPEKGLRSSKLCQALSNRTTVFCSLFVFLYVGSEVSMGGWVVTFLIENRDGGPDAGYVATGYWLGLFLGRLLLNPVTAWVGEQRSIYLYTAVALCLEFAVWFAKSLVGNAVVVGIIGFVMGPSYPVLISVVTKLLPRRLHPVCIAFIAAFGQTGSAVFPFITGALAQKFSPVALQPVMIVLFGLQIASWFCVPRLSRKAE